MFPLLAVVTLSNTGLALIGTSVAAAAGIGAWLFRKDTEVEHRRRAAVEASGVLRQYGLSILPDILNDYAVGDYSGLAARVRDSANKLLNPAQLEVEFGTIFNKLVETRLTDPQRREAFIADFLKKAGVEPTAIKTTTAAKS